MMRTEAQRRAWRALSPNKRRILMSHVPDDLERDMKLRSSIITALSNVYGPLQWDATIAALAEGDAEAADRFTYTDGEPDGMTFEEIGNELGTDRERPRQIMLKAFSKLRQLPIVREMFFGFPDDGAAAMDAALGRSQENEASQRPGEEQSK